MTVADVNNDGWPDIFLTGGGGDHRLLLNDGKGRYREAAGAREVFRWKNARSDDPPAGVCIADGAAHNATEVSVFCIPPSFNATADAAGDLPGPGAVALPGQTTFLP